MQMSLLRTTQCKNSPKKTSMMNWRRLNWHFQTLQDQKKWETQQELKAWIENGETYRVEL